MNPLADRPDLRKKVYVLFWFVSLALGAIGVGYGASEHGLPDWYAPSTAVYAFVAAGVGYTAASNTKE